MANDNKEAQEEHFQTLRKAPIRFSDRKALSTERLAYKNHLMQIFKKAGDIHQNDSTLSMKESVRLAIEELNNGK